MLYSPVLLLFLGAIGVLAARGRGEIKGTSHIAGALVGWRSATIGLRGAFYWGNTEQSRAKSWFSDSLAL